MDCNPPGSVVPGILQARTLEWVAISFSRRSSQTGDATQVSCTAGRFFYHLSHHRSPSVVVCMIIILHILYWDILDLCACLLSRFSHIWLFETLWTVACQASLSMGFSRPAYWSGLPCPPPGELPNPGIKPSVSLCPLHWAGGFFTTRASWEAHSWPIFYINLRAMT